jgi:hypothetical protein
MEMEIRIFTIMDEIVKSGGFTKRQWAQASRLSAARISDLSRLAKHTKLGKLASDRKTLKREVGRAFTIDKALALLGGIQGLMGKTGIEKLLSRLHEIENEDHRNFIMLECLPKDQKDSARVFLETLTKASYPDVVFKK